jgi:hypothetical protein
VESRPARPPAPRGLEPGPGGSTPGRAGVEVAFTVRNRQARNRPKGGADPDRARGLSAGDAVRRSGSVPPASQVVVEVDVEAGRPGTRLVIADPTVGRLTDAGSADPALRRARARPPRPTSTLVVAAISPWWRRRRSGKLTAQASADGVRLAWKEESRMRLTTFIAVPRKGSTSTR